MKNKNGISARHKSFVRYLHATSGITLIALVITIIVLLILAGVSLSVVVGENGILEQTQTSKEQTEIASEKEYIGLAVASIKMQKDKTLTVDKLQKELDNSMGENVAEVQSCGKGFDVLIVDKNRYHEVDEDGKITGMEYIVEIEHAGDVTKGKKLDGSQSNPYEISCIEDLVAFSNMCNGNGVKIINGIATTITSSNNFSGKNIVLTKNLNFECRYSYENWERTDFGDINANTEDGNSLMNEMTTGTGFKPINGFVGTFDGKENYLYNIYMNYTTDKIALFGQLGNNSKIQNLNITGNITGGNYVAGIVAQRTSGNIIRNCNNYVNVKGNSTVAGIIAYALGTSIINCNNYGEILGVHDVGGVVGGYGKISNCNNYGKITGTGNTVGGVVGVFNYDGDIVEKCCNKGEVIGNIRAGGIIGRLNNAGLVKQCYNAGEIKGESQVGGMAGFCWRNGYIVDSYNVGSIEGTDKIGGIVGDYDNYSNYISSNCYNIGEIVGLTNNTVGSIFGTKSNSKIEYMYYLNSLPNSGIGNASDSENVVEGKSKEELCSDEMIELLTQNSSSENTWTKDTNNINNGYPILSWQVE